jgi:hypothetical protein
MTVDKNNLIGKRITNNIVLYTEIIGLDKNLPDNEVENFVDWVKGKSIELGVGLHNVYYCYTDNYEDDITVELMITYSNI